MKQSLHFAHGNGFPSPCYQQLLKYLQREFTCTYIDRIGHSSQYPVTENWHCLVDEVMASIKSQAVTPVIAVGHSLGGVLSFLAAIEEPTLFKAVILLDSPIIGPLKSHGLRLAKVLGLVDHVTPAFRTRGRRHHWKTKAEALTYLRSRNLFKDFTEACLEDYVKYGMVKNINGYGLRFDKQIEYQIYRTIPHILHEYKGLLKTPVALIYGSRSNVISQLDLHYMKKNFDVVSYKIEGTHMFPMEHPEMTANLIIKAVGAIV